MAVTLSKLSGSTNGRRILVVGTNTGTATTIHTHDASGVDYVTLNVANSAASSEKLTVEWGGDTDPDDLIEVTIPPEGGQVILAVKEPLSGSLVITAFSPTGSVLTIGGKVYKVT